MSGQGGLGCLGSGRVREDQELVRYGIGGGNGGVMWCGVNLYAAASTENGSVICTKNRLDVVLYGA